MHNVMAGLDPVIAIKAGHNERAQRHSRERRVIPPAQW